MLQDKINNEQTNQIVEVSHQRIIETKTNLGICHTQSNIHQKGYMHVLYRYS